jgi:hypothetical protein
MAAPTYRSSRTLDILKGVRLDDGRLDYALPIPSGATLTDYIPGKVGRRNTSGELVLGLSGEAMCFFMNGFAADDPDMTYSAGDPSTDRGSAVSIGPGGRAGMPCLVGLADWELRSTAYIAAAWAIDKYITSDDTDGRLKLVAGAWDSVAVCGIVSRLYTANQDGFTGLTFWAFFHPAATP